MPITYLRSRNGARGGAARRPSSTAWRWDAEAGAEAGSWAAALLLLGALALVVLVLVRGLIAPARPLDDRAAAEGGAGWRARLRGVPGARVGDRGRRGAERGRVVADHARLPGPRRADACRLRAADRRDRPAAGRQARRRTARARAGRRDGRRALRRARRAHVRRAPSGRRCSSARSTRDCTPGSRARAATTRPAPAAPEPPLYYALEAIPYRARERRDAARPARADAAAVGAAGGRDGAVRVPVRARVPAGRPWAWTVGALGAALTPLLGFVSGGVNPDALLFAICAALFYALARAFRRGLTPRLRAPGSAR